MLCLLDSLAVLVVVAALNFIPGIQDHAKSVAELVLYAVLGAACLTLLAENLFYKFRNIALHKLSIGFKGTRAATC